MLERVKLTKGLMPGLIDEELGKNEKFKVYVKDAARIPIKVNYKNRTAKILTKDQMCIYIKKIAHDMENSPTVAKHYSNPSALLFVEPTQIENALKLWLWSDDNEFKEKLKPFAFKSDPDFTFSRCDFDPEETAYDTPVWDKLLSNFKNNGAIMTFIGSLFFPESYSHQYLWIYGDGQNGKGAIVRAIKNLFGEAFRAMQPPMKNGDKYWSYPILGKRLIAFTELEDHKFVKEPIFKILTGGDMMPAEKKFGDSFDFIPECKVIITSNIKPTISLGKSDQRRIILASVIDEKEIPWDPTFEGALRAELNGFISNCVLLYRMNCPTHGPIPHDSTEAKQVGEEYEEKFEAFLEENFIVEAGAVCLASEFGRIYALKGRGILKQELYRFLRKRGVQINVLKRLKDRGLKKCYLGIRAIESWIPVEGRKHELTNDQTLYSVTPL